jgi:SAM-dependent methyltransferase
MQMEQKEWYKHWFNSPYYHLLYEDRNEMEAAIFIDLLLQHLKPKDRSLMLDIACGKGRHSLQLAKKGYQVTGIDISPESIKAAQLQAGESAEFFIHDMRVPFRVNYYDYAFNFFTSFGYFDTEREHINAIHNMMLSLKRNGILVIDYLNPEYIIQHLESTSEVQHGHIHFLIERKYDDAFFYKTITVKDPQQDKPLIFTEKVAKFNLDTFEKMFKINGLSTIEVFGDYQLTSFDPLSSPRMIMIAKKQAILV